MYGAAYGAAYGAVYDATYGAVYGAAYGAAYGAVYDATYGAEYGAVYAGAYGEAMRGAAYKPRLLRSVADLVEEDLTSPAATDLVSSAAATKHTTMASRAKDT